MDALAAGLITLANGLLGIADAVLSPVVAAVVVMAVSLTWLALLEVDELNRQGIKPQVEDH